MKTMEQVPKDSLTLLEGQERQFWEIVTDDGRIDSIESLVNKFTDCPGLLEGINAYSTVFEEAVQILELGAGEGWASCLINARYRGTKQMTVTDISGAALAAVPRWERIFDTKVSRVVECKSYEVPIDAGSLDLVYAYASAHHFRAHRRTLAEVFRILRPGGKCLYLHEPSCPRWLYGVAKRRLNATRPEVPEDVLVASTIHRLGQEAGFVVESRFDLSIAKRGRVEYLYYLFGMRPFPFLRRLLPCTRHFLFKKP